jgi:hypothetical protein
MTPLPCYIADQTPRFHPGEVTLNCGAAGAGQGLSHRGRDERPLSQHSAQGWWRAARKRASLDF